MHGSIFIFSHLAFNVVVPCINVKVFPLNLFFSILITSQPLNIYPSFTGVLMVVVLPALPEIVTLFVEPS